MPPEPEPVRCRCGEVLLDGLDDHHVTVGEDEFRFRRTTDFVGCPACGTLYHVRELVPGVNRDGVSAPEEQTADPLDELRKLAEDIDAHGASRPDPDGDEERREPG